MGIIKKTVRTLRKNQTKSETIFWSMVRGKKYLGLRFQRQYPIKYVFENVSSFFVADFYCHKLKLIIEIDGAIHDKIKDKDRIRDFIVAHYGYKVVRFSDKEIITCPQEVLDKIKAFTT
jgi:very-short-patch-repair endonuclease